MPVKLFGLQHHVHDMIQPEALGLLSRIRGLMDRYPGTVTMGEVSSQPGAFERVMTYSAGQDRLHMAYTLRPLRGGFDWQTVSAMLREVATAGDSGWVCWSFSNHDVERAVSRWNPRRGEAPADPAFSRLLKALLLSLRGSVCLYQGEELGLTEAELQEQHLRDPFGIAFWPEFRGRDGSRTPIPWQGGAPHGGFTTGNAPWLPVPDAHHAHAVDVHEADPEALLHTVRRFVAWRRLQPALVRGSLAPLDLPEPVVGFVREAEGQRVLALFNLSDRPATVDLSGLPDVTPLPASGFAAEYCGGIACLPGYGVLFGSLAPAGVAGERLMMQT
jgi:alpha-glucosidase